MRIIILILAVIIIALISALISENSENGNLRGELKIWKNACDHWSSKYETVTGAVGVEREKAEYYAAKLRLLDKPMTQKEFNKNNYDEYIEQYNKEVEKAKKLIEDYEQ